MCYTDYKGEKPDGLPEFLTKFPKNPPPVPMKGKCGKLIRKIRKLLKNRRLPSKKRKKLRQRLKRIHRKLRKSGNGRVRCTMCGNPTAANTVKCFVCERIPNLVFEALEKIKISLGGYPQRVRHGVLQELTLIGYIQEHNSGSNLGKLRKYLKRGHLVRFIRILNIFFRDLWDLKIVPKSVSSFRNECDALFRWCLCCNTTQQNCRCCEECKTHHTFRCENCGKGCVSCCGCYPRGCIHGYGYAHDKCVYDELCLACGYSLDKCVCVEPCPQCWSYVCRCDPDSCPQCGNTYEDGCIC